MPVVVCSVVSALTDAFPLTISGEAVPFCGQGNADVK